VATKKSRNSWNASQEMAGEGNGWRRKGQEFLGMRRRRRLAGGMSGAGKGKNSWECVAGDNGRQLWRGLGDAGKDKNSCESVAGDGWKTVGGQWGTVGRQGGTVVSQLEASGKAVEKQLEDRRCGAESSIQLTSLVFRMFLRRSSRRAESRCRSHPPGS
jgi:hypothetical protein